MEKNEQTFLKNNRLVRVVDYMRAFCLSRKTASKYLSGDREEMGIKRMTVAHFYHLYMSYPPNFKPCFDAFQSPKMR